MTRRLTDAARTLSSQVIVGRVLLACTQMRHRSCSCPRGSGENCHDGEGKGEELGGGHAVTAAGARKELRWCPCARASLGIPRTSSGRVLKQSSAEAIHQHGSLTAYAALASAGRESRA